MVDQTTTPELAIDNDVILKAVCYCLVSDFWPGLGAGDEVGVLGAARYVVAKRLERAALAHDKSMARADLVTLLATVQELEPTEAEVGLAAEMELTAQRQGLALDTGESQLAAMVIERRIPVLETGDKRAIRSLERVLDHVERLAPLQGRVRCLEQIVRQMAESETDHARIANAVCSEPEVDHTLTICFACRSPEAAGRPLLIEGLESYISSLRTEAPRVLIS